MKALTIRQPWASLIALGVKTIETRGWSTKYRGRLSIHAGARDTTVPEMLLPENRPAWDRLGEIIGGNAPVRGAIVASAELVDCVLIVIESDDVPEHLGCVENPMLRGHDSLTLLGPNDTDEWDVSDQLPYGDFSPGRWAWILSDVKPTSERCPACWGSGEVEYLERLSEFVVRPDWTTCLHCRGTGGCDPFSARGRQGLWGWTP